MSSVAASVEVEAASEEAASEEAAVLLAAEPPQPASRPAAITLAIARAIAFFIVLVLLKNVPITSGLTTDRFIQRYYNNKL